MIEDALLQYGILGLWTASLMYEKYNTSKYMKRSIDNNTVAVNKLSTIIELKKFN